MAVFNLGRIEQIGTPTAIYERPETEFVADFVGTSNIVERDGGASACGPERIAFAAEGVPATSTTPSSWARSRATPSSPTPASGSSSYVRTTDPHSNRARGSTSPGATRTHSNYHQPIPRRTDEQAHVGGGSRAGRALAYPAAGVTKSERRHAEHDRVGGLHTGAVGEAVREEAGCKVNAKYAGSSDEMVTLMRSGGGGQYDMVSASGDASLRLIYGKDVQASTRRKIPDFKNFTKTFQSPPNNTVDGKHYGISLQWGPNTLLYNTQKVKPAPTSWSAIYSPRYKGKVTVPTTRSRSPTRRST